MTYALPKLSPAEYDLLHRCQDIKRKYADGVPLSKSDRATVLTALRRHPRGREKFGCGVQAVIVSEYVGGTRCFFVIRGDGTAEDFSLLKCFDPARDRRPRPAALVAAMKAFSYTSIVQKFRMLSTRRKTGAAR